MLVLWGKGTDFWAAQVLSDKEDPSDLVLGKNRGSWGVQALRTNALETQPTVTSVEQLFTKLGLVAAVLNFVCTSEAPLRDGKKNKKTQYLRPPAPPQLTQSEASGMNPSHQFNTSESFQVILVSSQS